MSAPSFPFTFRCVTPSRYNESTYATIGSGTPSLLAARSKERCDTESNAFATSIKAMQRGLSRRVRSGTIVRSDHTLSRRPSPCRKAFCRSPSSTPDSNRIAMTRWNILATILETVMGRWSAAKIGFGTFGTNTVYVTFPEPCQGCDRYQPQVTMRRNVQ